MPIVQKILSKLQQKHLDDLVKIANTGTTTFDIESLRWYCGVISCSVLQQLSTIMTTNVPGIVKIHDLIRRAVRERDEQIDLVKSLEKYIGNRKGEMTPGTKKN